MKRCNTPRWRFYLEDVVLALHRRLHVDSLGEERPSLLQLVCHSLFGARGDGEFVRIVTPLQDVLLALLEGLELAQEVVEELYPRGDEGPYDDLRVQGIHLIFVYFQIIIH